MSRNRNEITDPLQENTDPFREEQREINTRHQAEMRTLKEEMTNMSFNMEQVKRLLEEMTKNNKGKEPVYVVGQSSQNDRLYTPHQDHFLPGFTPDRSAEGNRRNPMEAENVGQRGQEMQICNNTRGPRGEFPKFNGEDPRTWIRRCNRYFVLNPMTDVERVMMAAMNLEGKAEYWYMDYVEGREFVGWNVFSNMVYERFMDEEGIDVVEQFHKLRQEGSVEDYRLKFEELKAFMAQNHRNLGEDYYIRA